MEILIFSDFGFWGSIFDFLLQWSLNNTMGHSLHSYYCCCWLGGPSGCLENFWTTCFDFENFDPPRFIRPTAYFLSFLSCLSSLSVHGLLCLCFSVLVRCGSGSAGHARGGLRVQRVQRVAACVFCFQECMWSYVSDTFSVDLLEFSGQTDMVA